MRTLLALTLSLWLGQSALAAPEPVPTLGASSARLLVHDGSSITLETSRAADHAPGERVGVYVAESRPDPRSDGMVVGLRYAGDARVVWVGSDLVELELVWPDQALAEGAAAVLGSAKSASPTPSFQPAPPAASQPASAGAAATPAAANPVTRVTPATATTPAPAAPAGAATIPAPSATAAPSAEPVAEDTAPSTHLAGPDTERERERVNPAWRARYGASQSVGSAVDWADDGYGTGVGVASVGWAFVPERGVGRVGVRLEGVRGSRWVAATGPGGRETEGREPAVGYWLWTTVESASVAFAPRIGLALGVQQSGPTAGLELGVRTGMPHQGHASLDYSVYGALGSRWTLAGALPLSDRLRLGTRTRIGALPLHAQPSSRLASVVDGGQDPWRQQRADGTLRLAWDPSRHLTTTIGGGLSAYDLVFADAGPVVDLALELRW